MSALERLKAYVVLPKGVTDFEAGYLARVNRLTTRFYLAHIPVMALVAAVNGTGWWQAALLTALVTLGPVVAERTLECPRSVSMVHGVASMIMGGVLVHFGQGPVQIEMHFYFFVALALLAVFANPLVILAAALTVAVHHLALWFVAPSSVFNYDAPLWVVLVHAGFVVLESVAACYIARSFHDNVVGLERIVQARTAALDQRNRDMRAVLDNVQQGFVTLDAEGRLASEWSAALAAWFGAPKPGVSFGQLLAPVAPTAGEHFDLGWSQIVDGVLPRELLLDQLPARVVTGTQTLDVEYRPVSEDPLSVMVVVTDVTVSQERQRAEAEQKECTALMNALAKDRAGLRDFVEEGTRLVQQLCGGELPPVVTYKRLLHTLKGNVALFGLDTLTQLCQAAEDEMAESSGHPSIEKREQIAARWARFQGKLDTVLGEGAVGRIEVEPRQMHGLLAAIRAKAPYDVLARTLHDWTLESCGVRLERVGSQVRRIAERLHKPTPRVVIEDGGVRVDPARWASFWSALVHAVRNAVDHGIEAPEERAARGKAPFGTLALRARHDGRDVVIEVADDGRGVDWEAVRARAAQLGLPCTSQEALKHHLFADGLSTAAETTEVSGRGVGMGALRAECLAMGGTLEVETGQGTGTTIRFRIPPPLRPFEVGAGSLQMSPV